MAKVLILTLIFFSILSTTSLPTVEIDSVQMNLMTRSRVDCSNFDEIFDEEMESRILKGRQVKRFLNKLETLEKYGDSKKNTDTRAQIIIKYSDHEEKICADKFTIYQNGICYKMTDDLKRMIW